MAFDFVNSEIKYTPCQGMGLHGVFMITALCVSWIQHNTWIMPALDQSQERCLDCYALSVGDYPPVLMSYATLCIDVFRSRMLHLAS